MEGLTDIMAAALRAKDKVIRKITAEVEEYLQELNAGLIRLKNISIIIMEEKMKNLVAQTLKEESEDEESQEH